MYYVYILRCSDQSLYVGYPSNYLKRMERHNNGEVKYTSDKRPLSVQTVIGVQDKYTALKLEKYLKSGSGRAFAKRHFM